MRDKRTDEEILADWALADRLLAEYRKTLTPEELAREAELMSERVREPKKKGRKPCDAKPCVAPNETRDSRIPPLSKTSSAAEEPSNLKTGTSSAGFTRTRRKTR